MVFIRIRVNAPVHALPNAQPVLNRLTIVLAAPSIETLVKTAIAKMVSFLILLGTIVWKTSTQRLV